MINNTMNFDEIMKKNTKRNNMQSFLCVSFSMLFNDVRSHKDQRLVVGCVT